MGMDLTSVATGIVLTILKEAPSVIREMVEVFDKESDEADKYSGDGSEEMPYAAAAVHVFFVRYCNEVDIWTANSSDVQWATPILMLGDGWTVQSWVNPVGAKHLFVVSPSQKVYASTWAWGPVRHKIDLLEDLLFQYFAPDVLTPPMPTLPQDRPGIAPASSSTKSIDSKRKK